MSAASVIAARKLTILRAVDVIDTTDPSTLAGYLAQTSLHDHVKTGPATLRKHLADAADAGTDPISAGIRFGAWKAAQQICQAAGLPY